MMQPLTPMRRLAIAVCTALVAISIGTRESAADVWRRLTLRQTLDSKYVPKPAVVHFVRNSGKSSTWDANLGAKLDLAFGDLAQYAEIGPTFELQRNTTIEKKQNLLKAGFGVDADLGSLYDDPVVPVVSGGVSYTRDGVAKTSGITAKGKLSILVGGGDGPWQHWYRPHRYADLGIIGVQYGPFVGFEYENIMAAMEGEAEGDIGRLLLQGNVSLYPAPGKTDRKLELVVDASWRFDVFGSLRDDDRNHVFIVTSVNLYPLKEDKRVFGFGIDYVWGENPDEKFEEQDFWRFGIKGMF